MFIVIWFILLNVINKASSKYLVDHTSYELPKGYNVSHRFWVVPWLNFDGQNYLKIAINGYTGSVNKKFNLRVFFPFYPLIIRILSINLVMSPIYTGLIVSIVSFIVSMLVLNELLIKDRLKEIDRTKVLLLMLLFPASFFYAAFYTESLLLLLTLLTFYFLRKKDFLLASISTTLATATKIIGLALLPVLIYEAYRSYKETKKVSFPVLIAPLGIVGYALYTWVTSGDSLLIIRGQIDWGRRIGIFSPFIAFKGSLFHVIYGSLVSQHNFFARSIEVIELATAIFLIVVIILSFKRIKFSYWLYLLSGSLLVFFSGTFISIMRILIVLFPTHIYLAKTLPKKVYYFISLCFVILLVYLTSLFLRGYWVA